MYTKFYVYIVAKVSKRDFSLRTFRINLSPTGEESIEGSSLNTSSLVRVVEIPPEKIDLNITADVALPQGQLILAARDDTAEYDDQDSSPNYKDDPQ